MREITHSIRAERLALRDRLRANRRQALAELRASARAERETARNEWARRRAAALREATSDVERARVELAAARERRVEERRVETKLRADARLHAHVHREQSDEHVRAAIPRELVPLFDRVKRSIRGGSTRSRVEAFLHHAEKHPEATFAVVEPRGEEHIGETRAAIADVARAVARGHGVRDYEEKRAARIERLHAKAARLGAAAQGAHARAREIGSAIPFGQPVLVGHHSQRRHERDIEKIDRSMRKSIELAGAAATTERRARSAERNRVISADDPKAIEKLRAKLATLNANRERMRAANAAIRSGADVVQKLGALHFDETQAKRLLERDFAGRVGFPDYALRNSAAEATRIERRIRELEERAATSAPSDVVLGDARISEAENRVRVTFPSVPPEAVRRALKSAGFRWAPSVGAWQRKASNGAWHAAKEAIARIAGSAAP